MTRHTGISYLKSAIRIIGYIIAAHVCPIINMAMLILIFAEVLGIAEEWGEKYGRK
jgi:ATP/ADP translocase